MAGTPAPGVVADGCSTRGWWRQRSVPTAELRRPSRNEQDWGVLEPWAGARQAMGRLVRLRATSGQTLDKPWATPQATPRADLGQAIGVWRRQRGCISAQVLPANCERRREGLEASCKARCSGVASRHPANGALPVAYIDELRRQLIASRVCFE